MISVRLFYNGELISLQHKQEDMKINVKGVKKNYCNVSQFIGPKIFLRKCEIWFDSFKGPY